MGGGKETGKEETRKRKTRKRKTRTEEEGGEEEEVRSETGAGSRLRKMGPFFFVFSEVAGKIRGCCFEPTIIRL